MAVGRRVDREQWRYTTVRMGGCSGCADLKKTMVQIVCQLASDKTRTLKQHEVAKICAVFLVRLNTGAAVIETVRPRMEAYESVSEHICPRLRVL